MLPPSAPPATQPRPARLIPLWAILACALTTACVLATGCASHTRVRAPDALLNPEATVDLNATADDNYSHNREALATAVARLKAAQPNSADPNHKRYNILALSGGGSYGAFTAGVLNGWTASGERPQFDIVSGVSTGALISTFAFLGPQYDHVLTEFYTTTTTDEVYRKRCKAVGLVSDSFVSSKPLACEIETTITPQVLAQVAQAHLEGRRLFIGTTNVDTGRLVIWDMGAIASSGKPDSLALYRKIVLASASPPGFFPPVPIEVTVNGRTYTELHVDGGITAQVFFRSSMIPHDASDPALGNQPLSGSCIYVIVAGKAFPDPDSVEPNTLKIAGNSLAALSYAQTRNDLVRIYTLSLLTGMDFRMSEVPQDWTIQKNSMDFVPAEMTCLYQRGYQFAVRGQAWADVPPVLDASQQSIPRAGTQFFSPVDSTTICDH